MKKYLTKKVLLLIAIFVILFILTKINSIDSLDKQISLQLYNFRDSTRTTNLLAIVTNFTLPIVIVMILVPLLLKKKYKKTLYFCFSYLVVYVASEITKLLLNRQRPFTNSVVSYLGGNDPSGLSFPSGHSMFAFFLAHFICKEFKLNKLQTLAVYSLAILVAFSRVYLGAHYVLDVLGGAVLGTMIAMILEKTGKRVLM